MARKASAGVDKWGNIITEHAEQKALFQWWRVQYREIEHLMFAVPNGGARNLATGRMLKDEGVRAGIPDIFLAVPAGCYHGLWIEMKRRAHGHTTQEQKFMLSELRKRGYDCAVCRGWDEAREKIQSYLGAGKE